MDSKVKRTFRRFVTSFLIASFVFIFCAGYLSGDTSTSENKLNKNYFKQFGRDVVSVVSSPGRWKGKDLITLSAIVGTGVLIFAYDQNVKVWMEKYTLKIYEDISKSVTNLGDGFFLSGLMVSYYVIGEIFNRDNMRKIALLGMESFIISGALVGLMKFSVGRARFFVLSMTASISLSIYIFNIVEPEIARNSPIITMMSFKGRNATCHELMRNENNTVKSRRTDCLAFINSMNISHGKKILVINCRNSF